MYPARPASTRRGEARNFRLPLDMLLTFLACMPPVGTAATDTSGDSDTATDTGETGDSADTADTGDTDTGEPPVPGKLDECLASNTDLTERWSVDVGAALGGAPSRIVWTSDVLAAVDGDYVVTFDLPDAATGNLELRGSISAPAFADLRPDGHGNLVLLGAGGLRTVNAATGAEVAAASLTTALTHLADSSEGMRAWSTSDVVSYVPATGASAAVGPALTVVSSLGGSAAGDFAAGWASRTLAVAFDDPKDGPRYVVSGDVQSAFGDAVGVVPLATGGAIVLGGPDGYAWSNTVDAAGVPSAGTQLESPGIHSVTGAPSSAWAWALMDGFGVVAFSRSNYAMPTHADAVDLWVDPTATWLLTLDAAGVVHRFECE